MSQEEGEVRGIKIVELRDNAHLRDSKNMRSVCQFVIDLHDELIAAKERSRQPSEEKLIEALRVALGESHSMTMPQVRAMLAAAGKGGPFL